MADTTKLADTFKATRMTLRVGRDANEVIRRCKALGLQPKVVGYNEATGILLFSVVVPHREREEERVDSAFHAFEAEMRPYDVGLDGHATNVNVELICPPAPEPCRVDGYLGICSICGEEHPVMGPFAGKDKFLMGFHDNGSPVEKLLCGGTAMPPKGEVHRNYDGT